MYKFLSGCMASLLSAMLVQGAQANEVLARDMADPLFLQAIEEIMSNTTLVYVDDVLRVGEKLSYGLNNRLTISGNVHYQQDFDGDEDGFSAIDIGAIYRLARATEENRLIYDVVFGLKFGGNSHVRTPYFADSTYYAGLRFGRQWAGMTLAGTIKSSWIFDDVRGMSYIDFMPEAYFRVTEDWRLGAYFMARKSTNSTYDQEWLGGKAVRQFGRTQYLMRLDYEFEQRNVQIGAGVNVLF